MKNKVKLYKSIPYKEANEAQKFSQNPENCSRDSFRCILVAESDLH